MHSPARRLIARLSALLATPAVLAAWTDPSPEYADGYKTPLITDKVIPLQLEGFPQRPAPLLELGNNDFFGPGSIPRGHRIPTGAVWQPQFIVFGEFRTALQLIENNQPAAPNGTTVNEWVNRADLFAVLYLTPTERFVVGFDPLRQTNSAGATRWFGYQDRPKAAKNWTTDIDGNIDTFFFEGDFGSIFRNLDPTDTKNLDYHFTVGRQPLFLQNGMLAAGPVDMVGVTRASTYWLGSNHTRASALYGWGKVARDNNIVDNDASFYGVSVSAEYDKWLVNFDLLRSETGSPAGGGFHGAFGVNGQIDKLNTAFRVLSSHADEGDSPAVSTGTLLFTELSMLQPFTENVFYLNVFWGIDQFSSVHRAPNFGGPLGQTGILFAAVGMGRFTPALGNVADDAHGAGLGWQIYFDKDKRRQLVLETGFRDRKNGKAADAYGFAARYQQAFGTRFIGILEGYHAERRLLDGITGVRTELRVKF